MTKHRPEFPEPGEYVSDVVAIDGRLVRPGDLLVDVAAEQELAQTLARHEYVRYEPRLFSPEIDWRQQPGAPPYGDLNRKLERVKASVRLWSSRKRDTESMRELVTREKGISYNHVFVGEDFYHGGPGDSPHEVAGPADLPSYKGDRVADVAVLDNGLPAGWEELHRELLSSVTRFVELEDTDPLDENGDLVLDKQAGHGLFICGLIARMAPGLDIHLHRVLHATGEGEEALITTTLRSLLGSQVKVINLSLGAYMPGDDGPRLEDTIRELKAEDKIIVASAGNAGGTDFGPGPLFPARMPEVLAVGAYNSATGEFWDKSCYGDVYAPGVDVRSAHVSWSGNIDWSNDPGPHVFAGWASWSGTSFAAPLVAAELATRLVGPHAGTAQNVVDDWLAELGTENWQSKKGDPKTPLYKPASDVTDWG